MVAKTIAAVDVTLVTSDWESSPVAGRESLACETPVASVPVAEETLAGLPGCEVVPRDPHELAAAVRRALAAARSTLRKRALATSRPRTAQRIAAVHEDVLAR
jgi:glycosyltransferase involved in cell wall biosynthesis